MKIKDSIKKAMLCLGISGCMLTLSGCDVTEGLEGLIKQQVAMQIAAEETQAPDGDDDLSMEDTANSDNTDGMTQQSEQSNDSETDQGIGDTDNGTGLYDIDSYDNNDLSDDYDDYDDYDNYDEDSYGEDGYILPDSGTRKLKKSDLAGLSKEELRLARNEIYARHGRLFQDPALQDYFDSQSWYSGFIAPEDFVETDMMSALECRNARFIQKFE